ncbi:MAG TPA: helix-turn-helix domain-containing protein [Nonomuraea sp.]|nr:helix-turn-helix domain-containing protein [Nonomuraea sp.]
MSRLTSPQRLVRRARIVLLASEGWPNTKIAAELGCSVATVSTWRGRYAARGIDGLFDAPRSGRPEVHGPSVRLAVVAIATTIPPEGTSVWSHQMIADHLARRGLVISPASAGRILAEAKSAHTWSEGHTNAELLAAVDVLEVRAQVRGSARSRPGAEASRVIHRLPTGRITRTGA